jgi:hypothetical protein
MLEQELTSTNLLFKESNNGNYEFIHKTWQEFFTAQYLISGYQNKTLDAGQLDKFFFKEIDYDKWGFKGTWINKKLLGVARFVLPGMPDYFEHFVNLTLEYYSKAENANKGLFLPKLNLIKFDIQFIGELASQIQLKEETRTMLNLRLDEKLSGLVLYR